MNKPITKIICKKSVRRGGDRIYAEFTKDNIYEKFILEEDQVDLPEVPYKYTYIYIYNKNGIGGLRFHLDKINREQRGLIECFYDFFYDDQEIRKLKLKRLECTWQYGE